MANKFGEIQSIEQAIDADSLSIGYIAKHQGRNESVDLIALLIASFADSVNVGQNFKSGQIITLAEDILDEFKHIKIADLVLFFKMVRRGKFGEFYGVLSAEKIMIWLGEYFETRCNIAADRTILRANKFKENNIVEIEHTRQIRRANGYIQKVTDKITKRL